MKEFVEKLIERLEEKVTEYDVRIKRRNGECYYDESKNQKKLDDRARGIEQAIEIINELAEEYNSNLSENLTSWIPCGERLPDITDYPWQRNRVLVSYDDGIVRNATIKSLIFGEKQYSMQHELITPVAWQPLPEPYKPEQQKEIPTDHFAERFNMVM